MRLFEPSAGGRSHARGQRGGSLLLVTLSLVAGMSVLALAIDLGMRFTTRSEVQRAADAAALAGASAFLDYHSNAVVAEAEAEKRAYAYAMQNEILHTPIDSTEVSVDVDTNTEKVQVTIRRTGLPTWFARLFGIDSLAVSARAAAAVTTSGAANCIAPWALVDFWAEFGDDTNGNRIPDANENWSFDPNAPGPVPDDYYVRVGDPPPVGQTETGLGSGYRNSSAGGSGHHYSNDYGRPVKIRPANTSQPGKAGQFYPWADDDGEFDNGYVDRLVSCDPTIIEIGKPYRVPAGFSFSILNVRTKQALDSIFKLDPDAEWLEWPDPSVGAWTGRVVSSFGMRSPRVVRVPMIDPAQVTRGRVPTLSFNNMGLLFIEDYAVDPQTGIVEIDGRFLYYVAGSSGAGSGPSAPLIRYVHLTE